MSVLSPSRRSTDPSAAHARGFRVVAAAFAALMSFGTLPTPLWPLLAERDGFGQTMVTVAFTAMVAGTAVGFLLLGHLSDRWGRRAVAVPALLTSTTAASLLVLWHGLAGLLVARVVTGVGAGLMASTATAYLADLYRKAHPERPEATTPGTVATAANLGGLALGPLAAGLLAQWAPGPLTTPFALWAVALVTLAVLVWRSPETVDRRSQPEPPARFALRPGAGALFGGAVATGAAAFAVMGFYASLGAVTVKTVFGHSSPLVTGLAPFALFAASAVAQLALGRLSESRMLAVGVVLFPAGLALTAVSVFWPVLVLFLAAAAVTGAGAGMLFKVSLGQSADAARPASRAGVLAVFFVVGYVGMGVPSIGFSLASHAFGLRPSMVAFAAILSLNAWIAVWVARVKRG